jgi:hypothetical protein
MELTEFLILRKPRSGCLEERTALIRPNLNFFTALICGRPSDPPAPYRANAALIHAP